MSYEQFFHLKDSPFRLTPDPAYFFPSGVHKEALDTMVYSIKAGEGFVMITGTPGVGKTLLVRTLLRELGDTVNLALVLNPTLSPRELLWVILDDLGHFDMELGEKLPKEKLLRHFKDYLMENAQQGIKTIIIIDEAQNLPKETLEELRMLSNLETDREKLLQVILVGQLELEERLKYDELKQLAQRISVRYRLTPLTREESGAYVRHRLEVAGDGRSIRFMPRVLSRIHDLSKGIPRRINLICERALMAAYVDDVTQVSRKHILRAIRSIEGEDDRFSTVPVWLWPAAACAVLVIATVWFAVSYQPSLPQKVAQLPSTAVTKETSTTVEQVTTPPPAVAQVEKSVPRTVNRAPQTPASAPEIQSPASNHQSEIPVTQTQKVSSASHTSEPKPISVSSIQANARVIDEKPVHQAPPASSLRSSAPDSQLQVASRTPQTAVPTLDVSSREADASAFAPVSDSALSFNETKRRLTQPSALSANKTADDWQSLQSDVLPIDEYYLAVDRDANLAQLWQGTAGGPLLLHQFKLDWRIMEGLYILGNDKQKGAFIFNPTLFQWGGYKLLNASALWFQISAFVKDPLIPVVVYSGDKLDKTLLTDESLSIQQAVNTWSEAWRDKDIKELMGFYGKTFTAYEIGSESPQTYSKHKLAEIRGRILATSSYITLLTSTPVCLVDPQNPDQAMAVFRQEYNSNTYSDQGVKVLYLQREGSNPEQPWKIVAKFFLPKQEG